MKRILSLVLAGVFFLLAQISVIHSNAWATTYNWDYFKTGWDSWGGTEIGYVAYTDTFTHHTGGSLDITQLSGFAAKRIELFFDIPKHVMAASSAA